MISMNEIGYLIVDARDTLTFIEASYNSSIRDREVSIAIRLKIKHFLENIKSALDYIGYEIFEKYCAENISSKFEDHVRSLYFPNKRSESEFDKYIKNMYPGLETTQPDIVSIFKEIQPFTNTQWYIDLNELVNKNKHRRLSKQNRKETATYIQKMVLPGLIIENLYSHKNAEGNVVINGVEMNSLNPKPESASEVNATFYFEFVFDDLQKQVIPTLQDIYRGASTLFNTIQMIMSHTTTTQ